MRVIELLHLKEKIWHYLKKSITVLRDDWVTTQLDSSSFTCGEKQNSVLFIADFIQRNC